MQIETHITKKSGRILADEKKRPLGLWWVCDSGFSAKTVYGDFSGSTIEELLRKVQFAEKSRIEKFEKLKAEIRERRRLRDARKRQAAEDYLLEKKIQAEEENIAFSKLVAFYISLLEEIIRPKKPKDFTSSSAVPVVSPRPPMLGH